MQKEETEGVHVGMHFSQTVNMQDASLNQLREHIKQVMIPLLIKTFQCRLGEEGYEQLKLLDQDLQHLQQWISQCRVQVEKALSDAVSVQKLGSLRAVSIEKNTSSSWWRNFLSRKE